jgi:hypothetical protein
LEDICRDAGEIKRTNRDVILGFSFIVSWKEATVRGAAIVDNVDEMAQAARLARASGFDYITYKPLLDRSSSGAESIGLSYGDDPHQWERVSNRIQAQLALAQTLRTDRFRIIESLNLGALTAPPGGRDLRRQPGRCRMTLFRQVLTPDGLYSCPVYRGESKAKIAGPGAYESADAFLATRQSTVWLTSTFNATVECREIACLYNETNWWLHALAEKHETLGELPPSSATDFFL